MPCHSYRTKEVKLWLNPWAEKYTARTTDFFFVASEGLNLPHGSNIEDTDGLVP